MCPSLGMSLGNLLVLSTSVLSETLIPAFPFLFMTLLLF